MASVKLEPTEGRSNAPVPFEPPSKRQKRAHPAMEAAEQNAEQAPSTLLVDVEAGQAEPVDALERVEQAVQGHVPLTGTQEPSADKQVLSDSAMVVPDSEDEEGEEEQGSQRRSRRVQEKSRARDTYDADFIVKMEEDDDDGSALLPQPQSEGDEVPVNAGFELDEEVEEKTKPKLKVK